MVDSHKVWLLIGISIAILAVAILVFQIKQATVGQAIGDFCSSDFDCDPREVCLANRCELTCTEFPAEVVPVGNLNSDSVCAERILQGFEKLGYRNLNSIEDFSQRLQLPPLISDGDLCRGVHKGVPIIEEQFGALRFIERIERIETSVFLVSDLWQTKCDVRVDGDIDSARTCIDQGSDQSGFDGTVLAACNLSAWSAPAGNCRCRACPLSWQQSGS